MLARLQQRAPRDVYAQNFTARESSSCGGFRENGTHVVLFISLPVENGLSTQRQAARGADA